MKKTALYCLVFIVILLHTGCDGIEKVEMAHSPHDIKVKSNANDTEKKESVEIEEKTVSTEHASVSASEEDPLEEETLEDAIENEKLNEAINEIVEISHYPENFLSLSNVNSTDDNTSDEPFIRARGEGAHGEFRIAYYKDWDAFELHIGSEWGAIQKAYKNKNYKTSEGIAIGSKKADVEEAYQKYGLKEFNMSKIANVGLKNFDIILSSVDSLADTFLYIDNGRIFDDTYMGIDYWGGLGAFIFILDSNDNVVKIVWYAPNSG